MESYITLGLIVYAAFTPVLYSWLNRDKSTPLNLIAPRFGRSKDGKEVYLPFLNPLNLAWFIKESAIERKALFAERKALLEKPEQEIPFDLDLDEDVESEASYVFEDFEIEFLETNSFSIIDPGKLIREKQDLEKPAYLRRISQ